MGAHKLCSELWWNLDGGATPVALKLLPLLAEELAPGSTRWAAGLGSKAGYSSICRREPRLWIACPGWVYLQYTRCERTAAGFPIAPSARSAPLLSLFSTIRLSAALEARKSGGLEAIEALLGCPLNLFEVVGGWVMPSWTKHHCWLVRGGHERE